MAHNYKELKISQRSIELVDLCYDYVEELPKEERFNLKQQIIRCACSIPANIAKGAGKGTNLHFAEFVSISLGSCFELETHFVICERRNFGKAALRKQVLEEISELKNMIFTFQKTLN
jgi:four helix bundle protein